MATLHGVDMSQFNRFPDWPAIAASGLRFVAVRASEGSTLTDDRWPQYAPQLAMLPSPTRKIVYHLQRTTSAISNFDLLRRQVEEAEFAVTPHVGFMIDVEGNNFPGNTQILELRDRICSHWNRRNVFLYAGAFTTAAPLGLDRIMPWWLPWPIEPNGPVPSWAASAIAIHQYGTAGPGEVAGFPFDNIDVNQIVDDEAFLLPFGEEEDVTPEEHQLLVDIRALVDANNDILDIRRSGPNSVAVRTQNAETMLGHVQTMVEVLRDGQIASIVSDVVANALEGLVVPMVLPSSALVAIGRQVASELSDRLGQQVDDGAPS